MDDVTQLLARVREQDNEALNRLFSIVYDDLHRMARAKVAHNSPMTLLDPTSLVHEAYLRFQQAGRLDLDSRGRFMAYAAQVLRAIIVDIARRRSADRRGGGAVHVTLNTEVAASIGQHRLGHGVDQRRARRTRSDRSAAEAGRGDALFRRADRSGESPRPSA